MVLSTYVKLLSVIIQAFFKKTKVLYYVCLCFSKYFLAIVVDKLNKLGHIFQQNKMKAIGNLHNFYSIIYFYAKLSYFKQL